MKTRTRANPIRITVLCIAVLYTIFVLCGCGSQLEHKSEISETNPPPKLVKVETTYLYVELPEDMAALLRWDEMEEREDHVITVTLEVDEGIWELYRIYFGETYAESSFGNMNIDGLKTPVAVIPNVYDTDTFLNEGVVEKYSYAMESLQYVMGAIREDTRFLREEDVTVEKTEAKVGYWKFELPTHMECIEEMTSDNCKLTFYGNVNEEKYLLFAVFVGEETLANVIGTFTVNGITKPISVEIYELPSVEGWPEADTIKLYTMMDSINDVVRTITESAGFAAPEVEQG